MLALNKPTKSHRPPAVSVSTKCYRRWGQHPAKDCSFKDAGCHDCKKRGHIAKVCHTKAKDKQQRRTHQLMSDDEETEESGTYSLSNMFRGDWPNHSHSGGKPSWTPVEVSLGASASVISESMYRQLWPGNPPSLQQTSTWIHTYTGEALKILGCISVKDEYNQQVEQLPLLVISGAGPNLLGKSSLPLLIWNRSRSNIPACSKMNLGWWRTQPQRSMSMPKPSHVSARPDLSCMP